MKNDLQCLEIWFPMEPAPSESKKKWKLSLKCHFSAKKAKKSTFWILETPKKLFSTPKKFWKGKMMFYNCFYIQNSHIYRIYWISADFRPDRPTGRYICSTPPYCNIGLQKCPEVKEWCLSFHLVGMPSSYLTYWRFYEDVKITFHFFPSYGRKVLKSSDEKG